MSLPIRVRLTAAYVVTAAVLTAVGATLFSTGVHLGVDERLDSQLRSRAVRLASEVRRDGPSSVHAMTPAASDMQIQVIAPDGRSAIASPDLAGVTLLDRDQQADLRRTGGYRTVGAGPDYRLYAVPAAVADGTWLVVVATPLQTQNELSGTVTGLLVIAASIVVVLGGLGAWLLAGAALRPVERLRREVAAVSDSDPSSPVRVPPTGDEIAALAETMNALLARIGAGLARQRQFVADASHEVRTPLANLRMTLELARTRPRTTGELTDAIRHSEREVIRLGHLLDDLLVLAAADDRAPVDRLPDQPVRPLLDAAAAAAEPVAAAKEVALRVEGSVELVAAVHPGLIRQALDNLLGNAIRHTAPGSTITMCVAVDGDGVVIEVADAGPGFPDGFTEEAFERFRRAGGDRPDGGSGLGLAVVRAIARAHGGDATAGNAVSGGAVVRVRLPKRLATRP